ncbi:FAD-linked oxidoreductase [Xylaria bambusicola]|uniref:FAD-linked oxidoreductase n=1 Tax=Xylaria bambusicola TaxID=326684 RepID=UPI00200773DA|nr:FAD-linked oxidoreductase [Xylaria bambusicola]KAI0521534.1 FAD-linked oxidoreductase [Xylaria bambusicola]
MLHRLPKICTAAKRFDHSSKQISTSSNIHSRNGLQFQTIEKSSPAPLSVLPTSVLLRSLLVSSVTSKPYLLSPSLSILSFLSQPDRLSLLSVDRNPFLRWIVKRLLYDQFCTGENAADVKKTMSQMHKFGFLGVILTYAKETTSNHKTKKSEVPGSASLNTHNVGKEKCAEIESWRAGTLQTVYMTNNGDKIALKLTGAGPIVTEALAAGSIPPKQMLDALNDICLAARETKAQIIVDAEQQRFQKGIARTAVMLMQHYNTEKLPLVTQTYQCYLKRTREYLAKDLAKASKEGWSIGVKLVRGAYMTTEERSKIHDTKQDTDNAYDGLVRDLLRRNWESFGGLRSSGNTHFPETSVLLATHNKKSVMAAHELHQQMVIEEGAKAVPLEFAQLHGMADSVSFSLLGAKNAQGEAPQVSKCSTWGSLGDCLPYLLRRAVENREAASRTQDELNALWAEVRRRMYSFVRL